MKLQTDAVQQFGDNILQSFGKALINKQVTDVE